MLTDNKQRIIAMVTMFWVVTGVSILLGGAIVRLTPHAFESFNGGLTVWQWILAGAWLVYMLVTEGYYGFQKRFSPRFAARCWYVVNDGRIVERLLAPIFCMGYFGSIRKRILTIWILTIVIIILIVGVRLLPQPWRGIIDLGVVAGLFYGLITVYLYLIKTVNLGKYISDPELSEYHK